MPDRRRVTLAHVLSMTSGLRWNEDIPYTNLLNDEIRMTRDSLPLRFALSAPFALDPGADFNYNGGLTQVMAAVIERATRMSLEDYARTTLFEPLGITDVDARVTTRATGAAQLVTGACARGAWSGRRGAVPARSLDARTFSRRRLGSS